MREWRRTLKSWPKETSQTADPASLPAWLRDAVREALRERKAAKGGRTAKLAILFAAMLALMAYVESLPQDDPQIWAMFVPLLLVIPLTIALVRHGAARAEDRRRQKTIEALEARGEATLGGDFVGVAYADGLWHVPALGTQADAGMLTLEIDRLAFVGGRTRFELPASAIVATEIRRSEGSYGPRLRLVVEWTSEGQRGSLALEPPGCRSPRRMVSEIGDLRDRIERWRRDPLPSRASSILPPMLTPTLKVEPEKGTGRLANLLAALATFAAMIGTMVTLETAAILLHHRGWAHHLGGFFSAFSFLWFGLWNALATGIERRLPERHRFRPKEPKGVRDALRGVATRSETIPVSDEIKVR